MGSPGGQGPRQALQAHVASCTTQQPRGGALHRAARAASAYGSPGQPTSAPEHSRDRSAPRRRTYRCHTARGVRREARGTAGSAVRADTGVPKFDFQIAAADLKAGRNDACGQQEGWQDDRRAKWWTTYAARFLAAWSRVNVGGALGLACSQSHYGLWLLGVIVIIILSSLAGVQSSVLTR